MDGVRGIYIKFYIADFSIPKKQKCVIQRVLQEKHKKLTSFDQQNWVACLKNEDQDREKRREDEQRAKKKNMNESNRHAHEKNSEDGEK